MSINWKQVSKSEGYMSLKAKYVEEVQDAQKYKRRGKNPMRGKEEFRKFFKVAIALAMKYSHKWKIPIEKVLTYWESKCNYWWLNFYQEHRVSKLKPNL
jgi:hypothetical protein